MITVNVDSRELNEKLRRVIDISGMETGEGMRQEGRLLAVELAKYTQPFGFGKDAKAKGEAAIERDFNKVYPSPQSAQSVEFLGDKVRGHARNNDREGAKERFQRYLTGGRVEDAEKMLRDMKVNFDYGRTADPKYHKGRWVRGRIKGGPTQVVLLRESVQKAIDWAQKIVGLAKGAWAECAEDLGGRRGIPGWIKRNAFGRVIDQTKNKTSPKLTLMNTINYTSQVLSESSKRLAIRDRTIKLTERLNRIIKAKVKGL